MRNKFFLIFIVFLFGGLAIGFSLWRLRTGKVKTNKALEGSSQILKLPDNIDLSILFSDKKFLELKKYGPKEIKIEEVGRRNPFAPY